MSKKWITADLAAALLALPGPASTWRRPKPTRARPRPLCYPPCTRWGGPTGTPGKYLTGDVHDRTLATALPAYRSW